VDHDVLSGPTWCRRQCFSWPRVKGGLLWGDFEAWPSIMWTVLSGPDAVLVALGLWGNLEV